MNANEQQLTRLTMIAAVLAAIVATGFATHSANAADRDVRVVQLQPVVVVGKRIRVIELERVVVIAKRQTPAAEVVARREAQEAALIAQRKVQEAALLAQRSVRAARG